MPSPPPAPRGYHGLFHLAALTLHDRWVKRLRTLAFIAATSVTSQTLSAALLTEVLHRPDLVHTSALTLAAASLLWLVAYPAMWLRMITVFGELEARAEYQVLLHHMAHLHRHGSPPAVPRAGNPPPPLPPP